MAHDKKAWLQSVSGFRTGDILLVHTKPAFWPWQPGWVSGIIQRAQEIKYGDAVASQWDHSALIAIERGQIFVYDSTLGGVGRTQWRRWRSEWSASGVCCHVAVGMSDRTRTLVFERMSNMLGAEYDYATLLWLGAEFAWWRVARWYSKVLAALRPRTGKAVTCSEFVARCYQHLVPLADEMIKRAGGPDGVSPADLWITYATSTC